MIWPTKKLSQTINVQSQTKPSLEMKIKRGKDSQNFIYYVFGLLLALTLFLISILSIDWYYKIIILIVVAPILIYLFLFNARFQNKFIGLKTKIEDWKKI